MPTAKQAHQPVEKDAIDHDPNIESLIEGARFPATVKSLTSHAEDQGSSEEALDIIQALPDRDYASLTEVLRATGQIEKLPGQENLFSSN